VLRVRRRENDEGSVVDVAKHVDAEQPGHLHVEKDQLRLQRLDRSRRRLAVGRLADDFNPIERGQHAGESGAGNRLVVDDEGCDFHASRERLRGTVSTAS
jgi:hypothetical protein